LAEVERTRAVVEQRVADYGEVVLEAFQDVRDALVNEETQRRAVAQTRRQLQTARQALSQARLRYANGQGGYVDVVAEQASVAQFERQLVQQRAQLLTERVGLYRALGNAWTDSLNASGQGISRADCQKGHMEQEQ
jgi:outer membrane protein TolC